MGLIKIFIDMLNFFFIEDWIYLVMGDIGVDVYIKEINGRMVGFNVLCNGGYLLNLFFLSFSFR